MKGIKAIPLIDTPLELLPPRYCANFDEYLNGPTLEDQRKFHVDVEGYEPNLVYPDQMPTFRSTKELFIDWGYHLQPEFAHMFANSEPQKVKEHLFPTWTPANLKGIQTNTDGIEQIKIMGMKEMLDAADEYPDAGIDIFVKGWLQDGTYIKLDPKRDNPTLQDEDEPWNPKFHLDMHMAYDIDSIIITAHNLTV